MRLMVRWLYLADARAIPHDKIYWSPDNGKTWTEATGEGHRYAFTRDIAVDPWVKGKVWVSGISRQRHLRLARKYGNSN